MHAIAGTIGHDIITDEYARQQAKQASRERFYDANAGQVVNVIIVDDPTYGPTYAIDENDAAAAVATLTGGVSTPSAAASPPHDAEADREAKRLEAAKHPEFLAQVRAWADGEDIAVPAPADPAHSQLRTSIRGLVEDLEHLARQATDSQLSAVLHGLDSTASFRMGQANAYRQAALLWRDLLR